VFDHDATIAASVSVSGPTFRLDRPRMGAIRTELIAASQRISARLGYVEPK
jgi:DNA-binding IclR family transcriptional regulator